jgi:hypothetical protein
MASELLSSTVGGGGAWRIESLVTTSIAAGVTGTILDITAPAGKLIRLTVLVCSSTSSQAGISLFVDAINVAGPSTRTLADSTPTSGFAVQANGSSFSNASLSGAILNTVIGENIQVTKNAGNTTEIITVAYEIGEYK